VLAEPALGVYFVAEAGGRSLASAVSYEWSDWRNGDFWWLQSVTLRPPGEGASSVLSLRRCGEAESKGSWVSAFTWSGESRCAGGLLSPGMHPTHYLVFERELGSAAGDR
jgi:hypothetical protein